jgi:putative sigma-54 modulation protein
MNLKINAVGFTADSKLIDFIEAKIAKLPNFYDKIIDTDIFLKLDSHSKVKEKIVEIRTNVPGATLFVESSDFSFETAMDMAMDDMVKQLKKKKELTKS